MCKCLINISKISKKSDIFDIFKNITIFSNPADKTIRVLHWPVSAGALWRQVHAVLGAVAVVHDLTQTKVGDFDLTTAWPTAQQDVAYTTSQ